MFFFTVVFVAKMNDTRGDS